MTVEPWGDELRYSSHSGCVVIATMETCTLDADTPTPCVCRPWVTSGVTREPSSVSSRAADSCLKTHFKFIVIHWKY